MPPLTPANIEAVMALHPDISDPDELEDELVRLESLVKALAPLQRGLENNGKLLGSCLIRIRGPKPRPNRLTVAEMTEKIEKLRKLLYNFDQASWLMIAMQASEDGYYLPSSRDTMFSILGKTAAKLKSSPSTREGRAAYGHVVASNCASVYFELTRHPPKPLNYKQVACNDYGTLVKAAFDYFNVSGSWGNSATDAASEFAKVVKYR
jgi:hypothetical protein